MKPCSKVFDDEPHDPHTYYHGGRDVDCLGYSPLRDPKSDDAETPEEFFGLDPVTKSTKPYTESDESLSDESECTRFDQILDWWESRHQLSRDLMTVVFYLIAFTSLAFIVYNITG